MKDYVPLSISFAMFLIALITLISKFSREKKIAMAENETMMAGIKESLLKVNIKLDQLCATTTETRSDIKSLNKDLQNIDTRVSVLESDVKTLFGMIDKMGDDAK